MKDYSELTSQWNPEQPMKKKHLRGIIEHLLEENKKLKKHHQTLLKDVGILIENPDSLQAIAVKASHQLRKDQEKASLYGNRKTLDDYEEFKLASMGMGPFRYPGMPPEEAEQARQIDLADTIQPGHIVSSETFSDIVRDIVIKRNVHCTIADHFLFLEKQLNGKFMQNLKGKGQPPTK